MKRLIIINLMSAVIPISGTYALPPVLRCIAIASWGCNDEGICIDSSKVRGQRYIFNLKNMRFSGPSSSGTIREQRVDDAGRDVLMIGLDQRLVIDVQRYFDQRVKRNRKVSRFFSGKYDNVEMECR